MKKPQLISVTKEKTFGTLETMNLKLSKAQVQALSKVYSALATIEEEEDESTSVTITLEKDKYILIMNFLTIMDLANNKLFSGNGLNVFDELHDAIADECDDVYPQKFAIAGE